MRGTEDANVTGAIAAVAPRPRPRPRVTRGEVSLDL